jgi:hypothetical protein
MPRPAKAIRRSTRAIERYSKSTASRIETAQSKIDTSPSTYTPTDFATDVVSQGLDLVKAWLEVGRALSEMPPRAFIDIRVTGGGGNASNFNTIQLDETVAGLGLLSASALSCPGVGNIPAASVALANPGAGPAVDDLKVTVTVPNSQSVGLYQGFVAVAGDVVVDVYVSVHT